LLCHIAFAAFGGSDQLEEFLGIIQQLFELIFVVAIDAAASCAATLVASLSVSRSQTKQTSFTRIPCTSSIAIFNCWASSDGLAFPVGNALQILRPLRE